MNAQCQALADISRLVSIMVYSWCISKKFSYLSIVVGLARGVELTLITKKIKKKSRTYTVSMNTVICLFLSFPYTLLVFNMAGVPS